MVRAVPVVRRRRSKKHWYPWAILHVCHLDFSIRLGGEVLPLGFWLHFEASPVSRTPLVCRRHFLRPLEARSSASSQKVSMDALVTVCSWNPNAVMVLAWMLWSPYAIETRSGTQTQLCFWHGCCGHRIFLEPERNYGFGVDALVTV